MTQFAAVVDASVVIASFVDEAQTPVAERIFALRLGFLAPDLLLAEIANGLWRYLRNAPELLDRASQFIERVPSRIRLMDSASLAPAALAIACALDHAAYDAFYLAQARREGIPLITLDRRLLRKVQGTPYAGLVVSAEQFAKAYSALRLRKRAAAPRRSNR